MHRFPRALFLLFALAALAGCATTRALCTRLQVERDGACVPIAVHGVTERAIPDATHSFVSVNVETNAFDPAFSPRALEELLGFLDDPATASERSR